MTRSDYEAMPLAIEVRNLTKSYGDVHAVRGIDLTVQEGQIFGFLGSNGAGKTTTIEILEGFRTRTDGEVKVLGVDPATAPLGWRENIGIVLQESEIEGELTSAEAVAFHAACFTNPRSTEEVLELVGLRDASDQRASKLSGGQRRRLDLALALVGNPKLIFLDEPTTGFDPGARREAWEMIRNLRSLGCTVLLTTHYMDEAQVLTDRISVISSGKIVAEGTAAELAVQAAATPTIRWKSDSNTAIPSGFGASRDGDQLTIETNEVQSILHKLTAWASAEGATLLELEVVRPSLEDTYLRLIGENEEGATA